MQAIFVIYQILNTIIYVYSFLIVIYTLLTWVPRLLNTTIGHWLAKIVEPYLGWFERIIPPIAGISFAPVVALLVLYLINNYVLRYLIIFLIRFV
ncbi:YggT family protein [uncultured Lactobacillus sp.]|uniref:YggT family protein n=1 Tax=uncultured Lactobacillus sp. TaxID=153152 RepID=UPI002619E3B2|nr:YggT family protein [uncultured Lactobacillus sp.]